MASFAASAAREGVVLGFGVSLPLTSTVNAITIASDNSQPKMNAAPFLTPPLDARIRMNAVRGIGSRVIAKPMRMRFRAIMFVPICWLLCRRGVPWAWSCLRCSGQPDRCPHWPWTLLEREAEDVPFPGLPVREEFLHLTGE